MIIPDCDETFNYWDPLNLLVRGFGKQTWEYSPEFAIRSYAYLLPYYLISYPCNVLINYYNLPNYYVFYIIRLLALNGFTLYSEYKLFYSIKRNFGNSSGNWYLFLTSIATGVSHAGVALLPSSFAMQCVTMSTSYALNEFSINNTVQALTWIMIGGLVGWPFILVLAVPFGLYSLIQCQGLPKIIFRSLVNLVSILIVIITIDSFFYKRLVLIPLNIVLYNVFGGEGEGPEIFGVEDFSYYILNLLLNFNIIGVLGMMGILNFKVDKKWLVINGPLMLWCIIFGSQPHKEERFLYPIYSLIIVNAAVVLNDLFTVVDRLLVKLFNNFGKIISKVGKTLLIILVSTISILRTINLVENYSAPLSVSKELSNIPSASDDDIKNVCIGREWYHFPTSFFLPNNYRLRFIQSGFDGLLPGDFKEHGTMFDITSFIPDGMNNKNEFSELMITPFEQCDYYIDNSGKTNGIEPELINTNGEIKSTNTNWQLKYCENLINPAGNHKGIGRLIYIPEYLRNKIPYNVDYMQFCLLEHTKK